MSTPAGHARWTGRRDGSAGRSNRAGSAAALAQIVVVALVLVASACLASPVGAAEEATVYSVDESVTLDVNAVGDVDHEYVLVYDPAFFAEQGANFEEYPFLLVRRYRAKEEVEEIQELDAALDRGAAQVTLTFREPGRAYNMGDRWLLYGLSGPPAEVVDGVAVIREESTENSDFTLWQDLAFITTTRVALPEGADRIGWDDGEAALVWRTPEQIAAAVDEGGSVLQQYRVVFIAVFVALMATSLLVLVIALAGGRRV